MGICRSLRRLAALSITTISLTTSCFSNHQSAQTSAQPTSPPAGWPSTLNDLSVVWTAEPGIDVTTWPSVVVRAYTESFLLASIMGDNAYLYPGFKDAVSKNQPEGHPIGTQYLWPRLAKPQSPWMGTDAFHILTMKSSGADLTVVTCEYLFGAAYQGPHQGFTPLIAQPPPYSGSYSTRITMTAPEQAERQGALQSGPARTPSIDVFNGWKITSHQGGYFADSGIGAEWPTLAQDDDDCLARAPQHPDLLRGGEYPRTTFPTLPPSPGWPAPSAAS